MTIEIPLSVTAVNKERTSFAVLQASSISGHFEYKQHDY
jgi:hypothetical protein